MGFNKLFLPEVKQLKEQLKKDGKTTFVSYWERRFMKADAIVGPCNSDDFIKQILNSEYNYRKTGQLEFEFDQISDKK